MSKQKPTGASDAEIIALLDRYKCPTPISAYPDTNAGSFAHGVSLMSVVTLRLPDAKHARLKQLAASRNTSVNRLLDELATIALTQHDLMLQFRAAADSGDPARGLALLDRLDGHFGGKVRATAK